MSSNLESGDKSPFPTTIVMLVRRSINELHRTCNLKPATADWLAPAKWL